MQAGDYDEEAAQKKLEAGDWAMTTSTGCKGVFTWDLINPLNR